MNESSNQKIPLPRFLKILTSNNVPVPKAMVIAAKIYKDFNTSAKLAQLSEVKLSAAGVDAKEDRRLVVTAVRKAGYISRGSSSAAVLGDTSQSEGTQPVAGPSTIQPLSTVQVVSTPTKKKRKRVDDKNEFLPDGPTDEAASYGSLEFNEVLDEEVLKTKSTVVNRAPLMTAWATIVAERMGFRREEALSIASAYTEMNAVSKGISIGLFEEGREKGMEATKGGSQPYVDLMGRRVPLYETQSSQWRALLNGTPTKPSTAFSYISRAFRQTTPHIIGALRLLAESFGPQEVNRKAWALYAEFRPVVDGWGKRSEVKCETILGLRKKDIDKVKGEGKEDEVVGPMAGVVKYEDNDGEQRVGQGEPACKKARGLSLEEYEAALDQDSTFDDISLNFDDP